MLRMLRTVPVLQIHGPGNERLVHMEVGHTEYQPWQKCKRAHLLCAFASTGPPASKSVGSIGKPCQKHRRFHDVGILNCCQICSSFFGVEEVGRAGYQSYQPWQDQGSGRCLSCACSTACSASCKECAKKHAKRTVASVMSRTFALLLSSLVVPFFGKLFQSEGVWACGQPVLPALAGPQLSGSPNDYPKMS